MPIEKVDVTKSQPSCSQPTGWKVEVARAMTKVPNSLKEFLWRSTLLGLGVSAGLSGLLLWRNPGIIFGKPIEQQTLVERLSAHEDEKEEVFKLMSDYYYSKDPEGLMLVAWERLDSLTGVWVRPADRFPGKAGIHDLTPDIRVLAGPFVFGECSFTESLAMPGYTMVACPIITSYDVWGYVAAIVETDDSTIARAKFSLNLLAHRITRLVY